MIWLMEVKMNDKVKLWFRFVVIVSIFLVGFWYVDSYEKSAKPKNIKFPANAKNIVEHGEGWYSFDLMIGDNLITTIHHFEKPVQKDTANPISDEFINDWKKPEQSKEDHENHQ